MSEHVFRRQRGVSPPYFAPLAPPPPMEAPPEPMNRYISPRLPARRAPETCRDCPATHNRLLLEQLTELTMQQNQLLMDLLGAVNALTAALLTRTAQV